MKNSRLGNDPLSWIGKDTKLQEDDKTSVKVKTKKEEEKVIKKADKNDKIYIKKTADIRSDQIDKINDLAYWDRIKIREAWEKVIDFYFEHHKIKPRPESAKSEE